jgi:hypothetical protein
MWRRSPSPGRGSGCKAFPVDSERNEPCDGSRGSRERTAAVGAVTSAWDLAVAIGGPLGGLVAGASNAGPFALGAVAALIAIAPLAINPKRERAFVPMKQG